VRVKIRFAAVLVLVAGLVLGGYAALRGTVLAPQARTEGQVAAPAGPVVTTAPGILDLDGPEVVVHVEGTGTPLFIGVGRDGDVASYLGGAARAEITEVSSRGKLTVARTGSGALPDPAGVDIWAARAEGTGAITLTWPDTPGQWRVVVAGDGVRPVSGPVVLTWTRQPQDNPAPVLAAGAGALILLGAAGFVGTRRTVRLRRPARARRSGQTGEGA
jgi:hypothetical protein